MVLDTHLLTAGVLIFIGTFVIMAPVIHFIIAGWAAKRKDDKANSTSSTRRGWAWRRISSVSTGITCRGHS